MIFSSSAFFRATHRGASASIVWIFEDLLMKKLLLSFFVFIAAQMILSAADRERQTWADQPYKYEVRVGWGIPSETPVWIYESMNSSYDGRLSSIYSPQRDGLYSTGGFSAEFGLNFRKWFTLALQTSFCGVWSDVYDAEGINRLGRENGVVFNIAPQARFNWVKRPLFRMYSSVGVGLTINSYAKTTVFEPSFQFVPLGMSAGKDVFFFAEIGGGVAVNFIGYHLGLGYRF